MINMVNCLSDQCLILWPMVNICQIGILGGGLWITVCQTQYGDIWLPVCQTEIHICVPKLTVSQTHYCILLLLYHLFGLAYDIRSVYIPIQNKILKKKEKKKKTQTVWDKKSLSKSWYSKSGRLNVHKFICYLHSYVSCVSYHNLLHNMGSIH